jgi:hypothetical protein
LDQVTATWLAPPLRELLERGPLSDPAVQKRLTEIEQALRRIGQRQDTSDQKVDDFRSRLTDVSARDLERQSAITNVRRTLENVADPRPDLQNFRTTLGTIQRDITSVQEAASRLTVEGSVIDLGILVDRVKELEAIRDRLRSANGELLDASVIEQRIADISTRAVTQEQLDEAIRNRADTVGDDKLAGIETRVGTNVRQQVNEVLDRFRGELGGEVDTRFATVNQFVSSRVNDVLPGLTQTLTASLNERIEAAQQTATQNAINAARRATDATAQTIRAESEAQLSELRDTILVTMRTEVAQKVAADFDSIRVGIASALQGLDGLTGHVNRLDDTQRQQATALAKVPQDIAALRNDLRQAVFAEIDLRSATISRTLDERLTSLERTQDTRFQALARDVQNRAVDEARKAAIESGQSESRSLRAQVLAEMRSIAREEVTQAIREQVKTVVNESVRDQFASVPGLVATEVRRATANTTTVANPKVLVNPNIREGSR